MESPEKILNMLDQAYQQGNLDTGIHPDLFPVLAAHLAELVKRPAYKGAMDSLKLLTAMAKDLYFDMLRVQGLIEEKNELWDDLSTALFKFARWRFTDIQEEDRQDIVQEALKRLQKSLPDFRFQCSFAGYAEKILKNEFLRWKDKRKRQLTDDVGNPLTAVSLDQPAPGDDAEDGISFIEKLLIPDDQLAVEEQVGYREILRRIKQILTEWEFRILSLHLDGYTLEEIKRELGNKAPSISTISRLLERAKKKLRDDDAFKL